MEILSVILLSGMMDHVADHPEEVPIITAVIGFLGWMVRTWWKTRAEHKDKLRVERRLEKESKQMTGGNPGRTTAQLVEIIHDNQKRFEATTNERLDKITEFMGRVKEKLNMP